MTIVSNNCSIMLKVSKKKINKRGEILRHIKRDEVFYNELTLSKRQKGNVKLLQTFSPH